MVAGRHEGSIPDLESDRIIGASWKNGDQADLSRGLTGGNAGTQAPVPIRIYSGEVRHMWIV